MAHQAINPRLMTQWKLQVIAGNRKFGKLSAEEVGQFRYFDLRVPRDRWNCCMFAPTDDAVNTVKARGEGKQVGRNLDDELRDDAVEAWCVAQELNGIAEAMETADDHASATEGFPIPHAMRIVSAAAANGV